MKPRGIRELQRRAARKPTHTPRRRYTGRQLWHRITHTPPHLTPSQANIPDPPDPSLKGYLEEANQGPRT